MQAVPDAAPRRVVVLLRADLAAEQRVIQPGRDHQPGHAAQPGQPVLVVVLVQPGMAEPGGGPPADGQVIELGQADVHGPVNQHVEAQPPAGAELQHPDPALAAVVQDHGPHAARRGQVAGDPFQDRPARGGAVRRSCWQSSRHHPPTVDLDRLAAANSSLTRRTSPACGSPASRPSRSTAEAAVWNSG